MKLLVDALALLRYVEWSGIRTGASPLYGVGRQYHACPVCGGIEPSQGFLDCWRYEDVDHAPACDLNRVLGEAGGA